MTKIIIAGDKTLDVITARNNIDSGQPLAFLVADLPKHSELLSFAHVAHVVAVLWVV